MGPWKVQEEATFAIFLGGVVVVVVLVLVEGRTDHQSSGSACTKCNATPSFSAYLTWQYCRTYGHTFNQAEKAILLSVHEIHTFKKV